MPEKRRFPIESPAAQPGFFFPVAQGGTKKQLV
jgi:hypothetical protein